MIRSGGLDHIHLHVGDVEREVAFCLDVFGAEEFVGVGEAFVFLRLPAPNGLIALEL